MPLFVFVAADIVNIASTVHSIHQPPRLLQQVFIPVQQRIFLSRLASSRDTIDSFLSVRPSVCMSVFMFLYQPAAPRASLIPKSRCESYTVFIPIVAHWALTRHEVDIY